MTRARYIHPPPAVPRERRSVIDESPTEEEFYDRVFSSEEVAEYLRQNRPMLVFELALMRYQFGKVLDYISEKELTEEELVKLKTVVYQGLRTIVYIRERVDEAILDWEPISQKFYDVMGQDCMLDGRTIRRPKRLDKGGDH